MTQKKYSGWWFQTCFIFHHIWDVILPIDELHHFSRWLKHVKTTNQWLSVLIIGLLAEKMSVMLQPRWSPVENGIYISSSKSANLIWCSCCCWWWWWWSSSSSWSCSSSGLYTSRGLPDPFLTDSQCSNICIIAHGCIFFCYFRAARLVMLSISMETV